jgi:hypothetical protein
MKKKVVFTVLLLALGIPCPTLGGADTIQGPGGFAAYYSGLNLRNGDVWVINLTHIDYSGLTDYLGSGKEVFYMGVHEWDNDLAEWALIGVQVHKDNNVFQLFYASSHGLTVVRTHTIPDGIHMGWPFTEPFDMKLILQYVDNTFVVSAYFHVKGENHWTLFHDCYLHGPAAIAVPDGLLDNATIEVHIDEESDGTVAFEPPTIGSSLPVGKRDFKDEIAIWTDRGCPSTYMVGDLITIYFESHQSKYQIYCSHGEKGWKVLLEGIGDGNIHSIQMTAEPPPRKITFQLRSEYYAISASLYWHPECTIFVEKYQECQNQCFNNALWTMKRFNGMCIQDYLIKEDSQYCGYDPCANVSCSEICKGHDLWTQKCVNGICADDHLVESNSLRCGFDPCKNHCTNGKQDCGEYGVDCGGDCLFKDSDRDGIEDCLDMCPQSRCKRVDMNGCETDEDTDSVLDCEDNCPDQAGPAENKGCPYKVCTGSFCVLLLLLQNVVGFPHILKKFKNVKVITF